MFVSMKALNRRTVLRGLGAAVALPFMDAMAPALQSCTGRAASLRNQLHTERPDHAAVHAEDGGRGF